MPATRLAFVGRGVLHRPWTLTAPAAGVEPAFFERRDPDLAAALEAFAPDVVVVFTPHELPRGLVAEVDATAVAFLPDLLDLPFGDGDPWGPAGGLWQAAAGAAGVLEGFDPGEYARVLTADPLLASQAPHLGVWRSPVLPVDDALYLDRDRIRGVRPLFLGPSTEHREDLLVFPKHTYDVLHVAFGLAGDALRETLAETTVGIVLNAGAQPQFQPSIALHLAAGHLVVAEPMAPTRGLEPGLDHLVVEAPDQLLRVLDQLRARPHAFEPVRLRGRRRAEELRASRVWPRLLADLADDLRAFG